MATRLALCKAPPVAQPALREEWRFVYEWFSGLRWEHYRGKELVQESLHNFETEEECRADAKHQRRRDTPLRVATSSSRINHDTARFAA
jgi:hypothetical protein